MSAQHPARREFLGRVGLAATALAGSGGLSPLLAETEAAEGPWDLSWVDKVAKAKYSAVFDMNVYTGFGQNNATTVLDQFHEVYNTAEADVRCVLVMRQLGTQMGLNDAMWAKYPLHDDGKIMDEDTKAPAKRNPFWPKRDASWKYADDRLERFTQRGGIIVVCNIAVGNVARRLAETTKSNADDVAAELKKNLLPGAVLVPSGIFALVRAQNAGAAFMRG
jgi:hypothetical protein